ncbi:hypothetical protein CROQUDRAFT_494153 [Cronartium quercuum f. sp. fusiforme G11]|uniref:Mitochondrial carrier n=1 Tax=Cronartium quercuum f. sp. fusiforme G11 TaxID=708437 RepID=A0A9P6NJ37_9BASI|nr:hypothetical protein CROQUDRAFT_494153 [Cronartium quercuum f. sp. fusiforme G11]
MSTPTYRLSPGEGFVAGALGACVAVTFTNPIDVAHNRLASQHQSKGYCPKSYDNTFEIIKNTARSEGLRSFQRGLGTVYAYQFPLNGSRLGFYDPIRRALSSFARQDPSHLQLWSAMCAGALSGTIGAILSHPLLLVKSHMQVYAPGPATINHTDRRAYQSALDGLTQILRQEGLSGWIRGADVVLLKTALASSVQLPAYNYAKIWLSRYLEHDSVWRYIAASSFAAMGGVAVIQPFDSIQTKMQRQSCDPAKKLYKNSIQCVLKTIQMEGLAQLYKGSIIQYFRIAPHVVITLGAYEIIVHWWMKRMEKRLKLDM